MGQHHITIVKIIQPLQHIYGRSQNDPRVGIMTVLRKNTLTRTENMFVFLAYSLRMERGTVLILTSLSAQCQYL